MTFGTTANVNFLNYANICMKRYLHASLVKTARNKTVLFFTQSVQEERGKETEDGKEQHREKENISTNEENFA